MTPLLLALMMVASIEEDPKIHTMLVALMAGFLAIVLFLIVINDKPFYGYGSISSDPYKLVLERLMELPR